MKTEASLFGGGQGAGIGAKRAGYKSLWSVEYDAKIAAVGEANGFDMIVADVRNVDYSALARPYWLHMSPVCTRASTANTKGGENTLDAEMAAACCRAIIALQPRRVSLENVWAYRKFDAFNAILACLAAEGYAVDHWHLNAADYGVPQTRRRLVLVASKDHQPRRPAPTHQDYKSNTASMFHLPWRGWYQAIEDLIPSLPDSRFAEWQLDRFPATLKAGLVQDHKQSSAFVVHPNERRKMTIRAGDEPIFTVMALGERSTFGPRAFVVDGQCNNYGSKMTIRAGDEPIYTITASIEKRPARAHVGRVVKLTPRALARLTGLDDNYILPNSNTLACTVLGNMHMPAIQQAIMEING